MDSHLVPSSLVRFFARHYYGHAGELLQNNHLVQGRIQEHAYSHRYCRLTWIRNEIVYGVVYGDEWFTHCNAATLFVGVAKRPSRASTERAV